MNRKRPTEAKSTLGEGIILYNIISLLYPTNLSGGSFYIIFFYTFTGAIILVRL